MANGWGELSFGIGEFGLQGNSTFSVSGISSSTSIGSVTATGVIEIGWGGDAWNINAWGDLQGAYVNVTGISLTANIGSVITEADANVYPTGISLQIAEPIAVGAISALIEQQGLSLQTFTGNETTGIGAVVTGSELNTNITGVTIDDRYLIGEGWGRDTWGNLAWGVNYSVIAAGANGLSATVVTGNEDAFTDYTQEITVSFGLNTQVNSVDIKAGANIFVNVTEHTINTNIEPVTIEGTALVEPTGTGFNVNIGITEAGLLTEVPVTGSEIRVYSGNEDTSGNATVSVTGSSATTAAGQASYIAGFDVTGSSLQTLNGAVSITGTGKFNYFLMR